ncbi:putative transcription factor Ovo-like 1 [Anneissia japonica]|uniref:putative transcription factor Ovo-like 1 n=1 Tax=Anneissia japonica TaxID=1529436 RepID=UPI0014259B69|nr:putative transcription factor Ovo-like 1 [Anneissia japonica]
MKPTLTCNVCNKVFQTRFNYNRHLSRHTDVNQHQCDKCGKVFARHDNFVRHLNNKHGSENNAQSGYGTDQVDEPTTKRQKLSNNGRDFYQVTDMTEVDMKKFKTKAIQYTVKFNDDLDIHDSTTVLITLHKVFQSLINTLTDGAHPDDLIRMVVECPELDYPIQLPLMKKRHLTAELFLARVERVLLSVVRRIQHRWVTRNTGYARTNAQRRKNSQKKIRRPGTLLKRKTMYY